MFLIEAKKLIRLFKGYKGLSKNRIPPYRVNDLTRIAQKYKPKLIKISRLKWILDEPYPKNTLEFKAQPSDPVFIARIDNKLTVINGIDRLKTAVDKNLEKIWAIRLPRTEIKSFAKYRREQIKKYENFYKNRK